MCKGFMRFSRERLSEFEWLSNPTICYFFFRLLLKANYKDTKWQGMDVKRGQLVTGRKMLSAELNLSEQQIRTCIDKLTRTGYINQQSTNKYTIITICDYDSWQGFENEINQRATNEQPTNNQQITTIERNKEEIKEKKNKIKKDKDNISFADFEICWIAYNRKGAKSKSFEQWKKLTEEERKKVLPHIKAYVSSRDKQYQKDFERYLRDKVFEEVIIKGNETVYDPDKFAKSTEYRPITDGIFQFWDEKRQCLMFNGYIDQLNDGYTADNRPDGAKVACGLYEWVWSAERKEWAKSE